MRIFISTWIIAAVIIVIINMDYKSESTTFYGIAESQEIVINSEYPVEIQRIYVLPGQRVNKGDLLAEFNRSDLDHQINEITHRIEQIEAQRHLSLEEVLSRINQLESQKRSIVNQYTSQINELESQYRLNRLLSSELKSVESRDTLSTNITNPLAIRIETLKREMQYVLNPVDIELELLRSQLNTGQVPSLKELEKLRNELTMIQDEKILLNVHSAIDGIIGSVNFKEGEKVSPFSPIITLSTASPSYIKGYIHENVYNRVDVTDEVEIVSISEPTSRIIGFVSGVGSRIVDFPERLRRTPDLIIWGREVTVTIPENSSFLLGEKVVIRTHKKGTGLFSALSKGKISSEAFANEINDSTSGRIKIRGVDKDKYEIEASGISYIKKSGSYLIVSDESKTPHAIKLNSSGEIENYIAINGVDKVNDMEEITAINDSTFMILCSQSFNKKGNLKDQRKWLLKTVLRDNELFVKNKILLYDFLYKSALSNSSEKWAQFFMMEKLNGKPSVDIEALAFVGDTMLLGFKSPLIERENSVILSLSNYNEIFTNNKYNVSIGIRNSFIIRDDRTRNRYGISGFYLKNSTLYITATSFNNKTAGGIWSMDIGGATPKNEKLYNNLRPEGIAFDYEKNHFVVSHDMGQDGGSYLTFFK